MREVSFNKIAFKNCVMITVRNVELLFDAQNSLRSGFNYHLQLVATLQKDA